MSDDELRQLNPQQVVALVRRLEAALREAAGRSAELDAALAQATTRIAELEAELARRGGPPKTPQNSSTPPSKGFKPERPPTEGAKRGPPVGHHGTSRTR